VLVTSFDCELWSAMFASAEPDIRPSSDTPLHFAALSPACRAKYNWSEAPQVAVHGHALAEGIGTHVVGVLDIHSTASHSSSCM
jgi:hypothetical protein